MHAIHCEWRVEYLGDLRKIFAQPPLDVPRGKYRWYQGWTRL